MKQLSLPITEQTVRKSNALARAWWAVKSVYEPRLVALVAARVQREDTDFQAYEIPVQDLLIDGNDSGNTLRLVVETVDSLFGRVITLPRSDGSPGFSKYSVFTKVEYNESTRIISASFHPDLKVHFLNLNERFTEYGLIEFLRLRSTYSQRIFEILKSWDDRPEIKLSLPELFQMLSVPQTLQRYPDFRRYVLEKSHKDIEDKTSLRYEWEPIKQGKTVVNIRFVFEKKLISSIKSSKKNTMLKQALSCFKEHGQNCPEKQDAEKCKICRKLVRATI